MQNVSIAESGLGFVWQCLSNYWGPICYFWFFPISVIALFLCKKKEGKLFLPYTLFLFLTVYNPILVKYFYGKLDSDLIYYRFFWLLPVSIVLGYVCVQLVFLFRRRLVSLAVGIVLTVAILVGGVPLFTASQAFTKPSNIYKVPDALIPICQTIHQDCANPNPKIIVDDSLHMLVRQYDPSIFLTIARDNLLHYLGSTSVHVNEDTRPYQVQKILLDAVLQGIVQDPQELDGFFKRTETHYVVVRSNSAPCETFANLGYPSLGEFDGYQIFRTCP